MAHGGKREGSGRKKGSGNRPTIFDYWDDEAIREYFEFLRDNYKESDKLTAWVGDHLMGKAVQPISGDNGGPLMIAFDPSFNATAPQTTGRSKK